MMKSLHSALCFIKDNQFYSFFVAFDLTAIKSFSYCLFRLLSLFLLSQPLIVSVPLSLFVSVSLSQFSLFFPFHLLICLSLFISVFLSLCLSLYLSLSLPLSLSITLPVLNNFTPHNSFISLPSSHKSFSSFSCTFLPLLQVSPFCFNNFPLFCFPR